MRAAMVSHLNAGPTLLLVMLCRFVDDTHRDAVLQQSEREREARGASAGLSHTVRAYTM